jgi:RNA polymerase sigma factor (sigma-70 family)
MTWTNNEAFAHLVRSIYRMTSQLHLEHLIRRARPDDPEVCQSLVEAYYAYVYRLCLSILEDRSEAEDAAQETFIQVLRKLDQYTPGTNLRSWITTIAVNKCRDALRRHKARRGLVSRLQDLHLLSGRAHSPEEAAVRQETFTSLKKAVNALDDKHRLVVILRYAHGLSIKETAAALEISEGTVNSRLHNAVKRLRTMVGGEVSWEDEEG